MNTNTQMNRRSMLMIANRAKGIARLIAAGQAEQADFQLQQITFKINPKHLAPLSAALEAIVVAAWSNDVDKLTTQAESLIALAVKQID